MLSFLSQVTVEAVVVPAKAPATQRGPREYQPKDDVADLRIWDNGAVYPSNALVAEYNLEYTTKGADDAGNGFDVVDTDLMPVIKTPQRFVGLSVTPRKEGKIDIFRATTYDEDLSPVNSVTTQGTAMYGKETMLPLLKEVYNVVPNDEGYIDLKLVREFPIQSPNGIFQFPKTVTRGERKGETSYVRRENQTIFPIAPTEGSKFVEPEVVEEAPEVAEAVVEVPAMNIPTGSIAEVPATPEECFKTGEQVAQELQNKYAEDPDKEYDVMKVGNIEVEVEKETNSLFLGLKKESTEVVEDTAIKSSDPFATEEEEVLVTDADVIQENLEAGAFDEEVEEELVDEAPADPFADVPFTKPTAAAK